MVIGCDETTPADATLTLTSPKNGDSWEIGTPNGAEISWENDGVVGDVVLSLLFEDDSLVTIINDSLSANTLHCFWTVPSSVIAGSGYSVLINSVDRPEIYSQSADVRVIAGNSETVETLELLSPTNRDEWQRGKANGGMVRWAASDTNMAVTIDLLRGDDVISSIAANRRTGKGVFRWSVPDTITLARDYQVRVVADHDSDLYDISSKFSIIEYDTTTSFELTEPTNKTAWMVGAVDQALILWNSNNIDSTADIQLVNGDFSTIIAENIPVEDGMYTWTVPSTVDPDNGYQVVITPRAAPAYAQTSDRFKIDAYVNPATLAVIAPTNGDRWTAGETNGAVIQWTSSNIGGTVHIDLLKDGDHFLDITDGVSILDGAYIWTVPNYLEGGSGFEVYIGSDADSTLFATSPAFRINPSENPATITVTSPKNGDKWYILEEGTSLISWTSENLFDSVKIDLYQAGEFITHVTPAIHVDAGELQWTVPFEVLPGRNYQIYIESLRLPLVNAFSGDFTIEESELSASLELVTPDNTTTWGILTPDGAVVSWSAENLPGTLNLVLEHDDHESVVITESVAVDEMSYTWTVPFGVDADRKYRVRATSNEYPQFTAVSTDFTIEETEYSPSLDLIDPTNGTSWDALVTDDALIAWSAENLPGTLQLVLEHESYEPFVIVDSVDVADMTFTWTVPPDVIPDRKYHILATSNEHPQFSSVSGDFTINDSDLSPTLVVDTPKGWDLGEATVIEWESTNLDSTLTVELMYDEEFLRTITTDAPVDSFSFDYLVPNDLIAAKAYQIRLISNRYPRLQSTSAVFRVSAP